MSFTLNLGNNYALRMHEVGTPSEVLKVSERWFGEHILPSRFHHRQAYCNFRTRRQAVTECQGSVQAFNIFFVISLLRVPFRHRRRSSTLRFQSPVDVFLNLRITSVKLASPKVLGQCLRLAKFKTSPEMIFLQR